ncbi:hypothetical protein Hanom_Chr05g00409581 [Helianthus anomalus]
MSKGSAGHNVVSLGFPAAIFIRHQTTSSNCIIHEKEIQKLDPKQHLDYLIALKPYMR